MLAEAPGVLRVRADRAQSAHIGRPSGMYPTRDQRPRIRARSATAAQRSILSRPSSSAGFGSSTSTGRSRNDVGVGPRFGHCPVPAQESQESGNRWSQLVRRAGQARATRSESVRLTGIGPFRDARCFALIPTESIRLRRSLKLTDSLTDVPDDSPRAQKLTQMIAGSEKL